MTMNMATIDRKGYTVLALFSRWVGDSQVRVRVRRIGNKDRIVVDLFEYSPEGIDVTREKLNRIAMDAARSNGCPNTDFLILRDFRTSRKFMKLDGSMAVTNLREKAYLFDGPGMI